MMKETILLFILCLLGCSPASNTVSSKREDVLSRSDSIINSNATGDNSRALETDNRLAGNKSIRKVDFSNFQYHWCAQLHYLEDKFVTLENGKKVFDKAKDIDPPWSASLSLTSISYADIIGTGDEQAVVNIDGSEYPGQHYGCVYVFAQTNGKTEEIWSHEYGEKWEDGLRKIDIEGSKIIMELFTFVPGTENGIYTDEKNKGSEIKRANFYARKEFEWNKSKFVKVSNQLIPNPEFSYSFQGFFLNGKKVEKTEETVQN